MINSRRYALRFIVSVTCALLQLVIYDSNPVCKLAPRVNDRMLILQLLQ